MYTIAVGMKLLLTMAQYYYFKKDRQENISIYFADLVGMNVLMTVIFIKANVMYFSDKNQCWYTQN